MNILRTKPSGRFSPERLFRPESVAVIGAGTEAGAQVIGNMLGAGFKGAILPVDPALKAVSGILAYPAIASLPVAPDLAVITVDGDAASAAMAELAAKGTFAAIVTGMASNLRETASRTGVRVLGPGSFGIAVPALGLNASRAHLIPGAGQVALVSQSAALCRAVLDWAEPNGVGFSSILGIGGNVDLGFGTALDWLSRDPATKAILLDIRRIKDPRGFLSAARAAARLRPVVAMRAGGRMLDPSGLADLALEAALRRCGILSVTRLEDLLGAAETLTQARPARNERLAIVTNAIGPGQMAADAALQDGLQLAELSEATMDVLRATLPPEVVRGVRDEGGHRVSGAGTGFIYCGIQSSIRMAEVAAMLSGAKEVGGILVVHAPSGPVDGAGIEALAACSRTVKVPLLVCAMGETTAAAHRRTLADAGVPAFAVPEQAVRGFLHLVQDRRNRIAARELPPGKVLTTEPDTRRVATIFAAARSDGRLDLAQDEALGVLEAYGVPAVPLRVAASPQLAVAAAAELGSPVVLKLRRMERPSAAAPGGLAFNLYGEDDILLAAKNIVGRRQRYAPDSPDLGFLVERQVERARELLIRVSDDATFGPVIAFGQGGTAADALADIVVDLPPLNLPLAHSLIGRTRIAATLGRLNDLPAADQEAMAESLVRVSQLLVDFPEIAELEVNPLFATDRGVTAADAWIRLRPDARAESRLAISPYPAQLVEHWTAKGDDLIVRPVRPEDAEQHGAFFNRLSPDDVRFRFFSAIRELSAEQIARMTQVDYDREMAFIAQRASTGETVGVSRLVIEPGGRSGEFAVVVQGDMKGKGVASHLMERLIDWARTRGLRDVVGQVLADNAPMLGFIKRLGFQIHRVPQEDDVVEARLTLDEPG